MDIEDLTLKQIREIASLIGNQAQESKGLCSQIGKKVIIRTYSAGVWFGTLSQKDHNEVILTNARRMYQWWAAESISLSAVALYGIKQDKSRIVAAVPEIWLEAIEILPCSEKAISDLEGATNVQAD